VYISHTYPFGRFEEAFAVAQRANSATVMIESAWALIFYNEEMRRMAIIIQAALKAKPGQRNAMAAACRAAMAGSQVEPGCNTYRYTIDLDDSDVFHIIEIWEDEAALSAHFGGRPFQDFMATAGPILEPIRMSASQGTLVPYVVPMPA
jgi:quinol monooxygenase YgiN